jgi:hypothetical protein
MSRSIPKSQNRFLGGINTITSSSPQLPPSQIVTEHQTAQSNLNSSTGIVDRTCIDLTSGHLPLGLVLCLLIELEKDFL